MKKHEINAVDILELTKNDLQLEIQNLYLKNYNEKIFNIELGLLLENFIKKHTEILSSRSMISQNELKASGNPKTLIDYTMRKLKQDIVRELVNVDITITSETLRDCYVLTATIPVFKFNKHKDSFCE